MIHIFKIKQYIKMLPFLLLFAISKVCVADSKLTFGVNAPGSPPYIYLLKNGTQYQGAIPDVLSKLEQSHSYKIKYIDSFRKRTEALLYEGKLDGFLSSSHWLTHPNKLIKTVPVLEHRSYLYSNRPFVVGVKLDDISGVDVCARKGYIYPSLSYAFATGKLRRVDSDSQLSMLNMVRVDRCHMAVMHEFNALPILSSKAFAKQTIYKSPFETDVVELALFLRPELSEVKGLLDGIILDMKKSGELAASLQHHVEIAL